MMKRFLAFFLTFVLIAGLMPASILAEEVNERTNVIVEDATQEQDNTLPETDTELESPDIKTQEADQKEDSGQFSGDAILATDGQTPIPYQVPEFKDPEHPEKGLTWSTAYCEEYVLLSTLNEDQLKNLTKGWYVLDKDISVGRVIGVEADIHIILMDDCKLTVSNMDYNRNTPAIQASGSMSFYGQKNGTGQVEASLQRGDGISGYTNGAEINFYGGQIKASTAGSGHGIGKENDVINIYGGKITAKGPIYYSGISSEKNSCVNIYGGNVTATGGDGAAGIGSGNTYSASGIHIYGGSVKATGGKANSSINGGAAIGSGYRTDAKDIAIYGGTVTANSYEASAIGSGYRGHASDISIYGGTINVSNQASTCGCIGGYTFSNIRIYDGNITAESDDNAAIGGEGDGIYIYGGTIRATTNKFNGAIGSNDNCKVSNIHIEGGTIIAKSGAKGTGIGAGFKGSLEGLYISGGDITATGGEEGAGIGGSYETTVKNVYISGGDITAQGGSNAAGIGAGKEGQASDIHISGGNIVTTGGGKGAGIGAGHKGTIDGLYISGGTIQTTGVEEGAGIGAAYKGTVNNINISGGKVTAYGGSDAAGIGGGKNSSPSNITISNGIVTARGGSNGAGIGGGKEGNGDSITISGGIVDAKGGSMGPAIGTGYSCKSGNCDIKISDAMVKCYTVEEGGYPAIGVGPKSDSKVTCSITVSGINNKIWNLDTGDEITNTGGNLAGKLGTSSLMITNGNDTLVPEGITVKAVEYSPSIGENEKAYLETLMGKFDIQAMGEFKLMQSQYQTAQSILGYTDEELLDIFGDPDQHISLSLVIHVTVVQADFSDVEHPVIEYALKTVGTAKHYDQVGIITEKSKEFTPTDFKTAKGILQVTMPVPENRIPKVIVHTSDDGTKVYDEFTINSEDAVYDEKNQTVTVQIEHCSHLKATFEPKTTSPETGIKGSDTLMLMLSVFAVFALCACMIVLGRKRSCK